MNRPLTSLEYTALGIISKREPCRAHAVVREFAGSQTFAYRSGAGSVYPLLKRLEAEGLMVCEDRRYWLTESGRAALQGWLQPPFPDTDFATNLDILRSRVYFLKLLGPKGREEFLAHCREKLEALLSKCRDDRAAYRERGDRFSELAMAGAVHETQARLDWLDELEDELRRLL